MNILDLIFPPKCRYCGARVPTNEKPLCDRCFAEYQSAKKSRCGGCGRMRMDCVCRPAYSKNVRSFVSLFRYRKDTPGGRLILDIKDSKDKPVLELLSGDMADNLKRKRFCTPDAVVTYAPRKPASVRNSGTDQAKELAERIARMCGLPFARTLRCAGGGRVSQKELTREERALHVQGLYSFFGPNEAVLGKRVILVDDICTSGATTDACAGILISNGAKEVIVCTAGKT